MDEDVVLRVVMVIDGAVDLRATGVDDDIDVGPVGVDDRGGAHVHSAVNDHDDVCGSKFQ